MWGQFLDVTLWVLLLAAVVAAAIWLYLNLRARRLSNEVGSFRCWSRPDKQSGWTSGVGMYGVETLSWYRLVGFSTKPVYTLPRRGLTVSTPVPHSADGSVVQVRLASGDKRLELLIEPLTYNGLVSWIDSGPPLVRH